MQRFAAWNFRGKPCPACGFQGALLYREVCKDCWGSLLDCPKCRSIQCYGGEASGIRDESTYAKALATRLTFIQQG